MAKVAYIRVSTVEQNETRQVNAMKAYEIDKTFIEKVSGKNTNRPQLKALMEYVREGDTVFIESFSRLARDTRDLLNIIEQLNKANVTVKSLKENMDTSTPTGKLMVTMMGAIATFERELILERQREGIAIAKEEGKYKGRQKKEAPTDFAELYKLYMNREVTVTEIAKRCEVSRPVAYRMINEYKNRNISTTIK